MDNSTTAVEFTLNLMVNKATNKVLFAEAGKDVVDFLFGLLEMPLGTVVKLLTKERMAGSLGQMSRSLEALDAKYLKSVELKTALLNPAFQSSAFYNRLLLPPAKQKQYYACSSQDCRRYSLKISDAVGVMCPMYCCNRKVMDNEITLLGDPLSKNLDGYVKETNYTIMDDLTVAGPASGFSCISLMSKHNICAVSAVEERVVKIGFDKGLELLHASLLSTTVLSDVFLQAPKSEAVK